MKEVEPAQIEKELTRIWREAADLDAGGKNGAQATSGAKVEEVAPRVRATLSNILLLTTGDNTVISRRSVEQIVTELCISHPSRFFIIRYDPKFTEAEGSGLPIKTAVSSRCVLANSGAHVCSEEIYITTGPKGVAVVPNLLMSLFVSDVEVIFGLLTDPLKPAGEGAGTQGDRGLLSVISGIERVSNRLIYDSGLFENYSKTIELICDKYQTSMEDDQTESQRGSTFSCVGSQVALHDLNWHRSKRWRSFIAEQFSAQRFTDVKKQLRDVTIEYCSDKADGSASAPVSGAAGLLCGWFAACLDWKDFSRSKDDSNSLSFKTNAGDLGTVRFKAVSEKALPPRSVRSVELTIDENPDQQTGKQKIIIRRLDTERAEICVSSSTVAEKEGTVSSRNCTFLSPAVESMLLADIVSDDDDRDFMRALKLSHRLVSLLNS